MLLSFMMHVIAVTVMMVLSKHMYCLNGLICVFYSEEITAVMCLPLIMANKTSRSAHTSDQCSLDWTCIAVGFSSGHLRFYDEVAIYF